MRPIITYQQSQSQINNLKIERVIKEELFRDHLEQKIHKNMDSIILKAKKSTNFLMKEFEQVQAPQPQAQTSQPQAQPSEQAGTKEIRDLGSILAEADSFKIGSMDLGSGLARFENYLLKIYQGEQGKRTTSTEKLVTEGPEGEKEVDPNRLRGEFSQDAVRAKVDQRRAEAEAEKARESEAEAQGGLEEMKAGVAKVLGLTGEGLQELADKSEEEKIAYIRERFGLIEELVEAQEAIREREEEISKIEKESEEKIAALEKEIYNNKVKAQRRARSQGIDREGLKSKLRDKEEEKEEHNRTLESYLHSMLKLDKAKKKATELQMTWRMRLDAKLSLLKRLVAVPLVITIFIKADEVAKKLFLDDAIKFLDKVQSALGKALNWISFISNWLGDVIYRIIPPWVVDKLADLRVRVLNLIDILSGSIWEITWASIKQVWHMFWQQFAKIELAWNWGLYLFATYALLAVLSKITSTGSVKATDPVVGVWDYAKLLKTTVVTGKKVVNWALSKSKKKDPKSINEQKRHFYEFALQYHMTDFANSQAKKLKLLYGLSP
jgi:hypothetical protein